MKFFILTIILLFSVLNNSTLIAATVLGTGSGALLGNDLTDPEDNGVDSGTNGSNFNWTSINASSKKTFAGEGSYSVFDNNVSSGSAKWCCDNPTQWIYVQFSQSYVLSHFTITSGNDVAGRDPDIWKIQGSNDGSNWTDIYSYSNNGNSPFSARLQVIKYTGAGDDFATPDSYSYFRYYVTSTVSSGHQINELEFFGDADSTAPTLNSSTPTDNATSVSESANIVLNFSESVDAESGNITIKKTSDNSTVETIDVTGSKVTGSGSSQITVNPATTLDSSTEYYVLIDASAFDDSSSNSYAGISSTTALSFTTGDSSNPTLGSSTPTDNATSVSESANIVLNFSESVDAESGNITIKKTSD
ncbi:MAG: Ig-like domain-containing protein, partial [Gammaproteobacteria bacterium]|nr:Ig-like domain-containing protein [Gammaproteobacteria bacterium]